MLNLVKIDWDENVICTQGFEVRQGAVGVAWEEAEFLARVDATHMTHAIEEGSYDYLIKGFTSTPDKTRIEYSLNAQRITVNVPACGA